jgi:hypothetical protein
MECFQLLCCGFYILLYDISTIQYHYVEQFVNIYVSYLYVEQIYCQDTKLDS